MATRDREFEEIWNLARKSGQPLPALTEDDPLDPAAMNLDRGIEEDKKMLRAFPAQEPSDVQPTDRFWMNERGEIQRTPYTPEEASFLRDQRKHEAMRAHGLVPKDMPDPEPGAVSLVDRFPDFDIPVRGSERFERTLAWNLVNAIEARRAEASDASAQVERARRGITAFARTDPQGAKRVAEIADKELLRKLSGRAEGDGGAEMTAGNSVDDDVQPHPEPNSTTKVSGRVSEESNPTLVDNINASTPEQRKALIALFREIKSKTEENGNSSGHLTEDVKIFYEKLEEDFDALTGHLLLNKQMEARDRGASRQEIETVTLSPEEIDAALDQSAGTAHDPVMNAAHAVVGQYMASALLAGMAEVAPDVAKDLGDALDSDTLREWAESSREKILAVTGVPDAYADSDFLKSMRGFGSFLAQAVPASRVASLGAKGIKGIRVLDKAWDTYSTTVKALDKAMNSAGIVGRLTGKALAPKKAVDLAKYAREEAQRARDNGASEEEAGLAAAGAVLIRVYARGAVEEKASKTLSAAKKQIAEVLPGFDLIPDKAIGRIVKEIVGKPAEKEAKDLLIPNGPEGWRVDSPR